VTRADAAKWGVISRSEGQKLLVADMGSSIDAVKRLVKVDLTQPEFDALVSFTFNVGHHGLAVSDALRDLNAGRYGRVPGDFLHFDPESPGLQRRHREEGAMFAHGTYPR
jgi:GH24 family phage-related lysozyme (muramidase)